MPPAQRPPPVPCPPGLAWGPQGLPQLADLSALASGCSTPAVPGPSTPGPWHSLWPLPTLAFRVLPLPPPLHNWISFTCPVLSKAPAHQASSQVPGPAPGILSHSPPRPGQ